ncbi:MAG TPA: YifB family Mg chelatase-like AAA ATPase, partial [Candidatus Merdenecus merdavium]|nr:YifB family Mg chelatase-like AAA ATPase [Candidatus Merdenecus merdavium]
MYCIVKSAVTHGITSHIIQVEVDISDGMPSFSMVGYLSSEVREAADRVRTAIKNSGIKMPVKKITVNLSPADLRKEGSTFDLPIAVSILSALGYVTQISLDGILFVGELSLSGQIHSVSGILPIVSKAKEEGFHTCIVPKENAKEGGIVDGIDVIGISNLEEMISYLNDPYRFEPEYVSYEELLSEDKKQNQIDFSQIKGQKPVKRATEVAVSGFHNLMFIGPPGSGKTMIAKRIPTILPPLTLEESIELSKVYSVLGMLPADQPLITRRPFRNPHHTVTPVALAGGGRKAKPGEISMAHKGVLFLDEFPEFSKSTLEILRQPLEEGKIHIARNYGNYTYPSNIMLVAAMNPCNCGYFPDRHKCSCTSTSIQRYLS